MKTITMTINGKTTEQIIADIEAQTSRSAWSRGVEAYAIDLFNELLENISGGYVDLESVNDDRQALHTALKDALLNGARDWYQYSWGGCALCYDYQIAETLCTPSELKKTRNGERSPNGQEEWLDVQARALGQAARRIYKAIES